MLFSFKLSRFGLRAKGGGGGGGGGGEAKPTPVTGWTSSHERDDRTVRSCSRFLESLISVPPVLSPPSLPLSLLQGWPPPPSMSSLKIVRRGFTIVFLSFCLSLCYSAGTRTKVIPGNERTQQRCLSSSSSPPLSLSYARLRGR